MDAIKLLENDEFFYADFIAIRNSKIFSYDLTDGKITLNQNATINEFDIVEIYIIFSVEINGSIYAGGESPVHGSYGFFYKKTDGFLDWALTSLDSNPFIGVENFDNCVRFLSSSGFGWIVANDDIVNAYIDPTYNAFNE
ncbi:MAG: hypothetical protein V4605_02910 [Pseudomonadota bacterium]